MNPDIRTQVSNVIAGRSAMGAPGLGRMNFPRDPGASATVRHYTSTFVTYCPAQDDRTRTVFIRKLAGYMIRSAIFENNPLLFIGTCWFARYPAAVLSPMAFSSAVRRSQQELERATADRKRIVRDQLHAAMAVPEPPCPVLLADGDYQLIQFVHPMHLLRAGREADNCLAAHIGNALLPNPRYWQLVEQGEALLFAISKGAALCAIFEIKGDTLRQWEYIRPPSDLFPFVIKCTAALEARLGPIRDDPPIVIVDREIVFPTLKPTAPMRGPHGRA